MEYIEGSASPAPMPFHTPADNGPTILTWNLGSLAFEECRNLSYSAIITYHEQVYYETPYTITSDGFYRIYPENGRNPSIFGPVGDCKFWGDAYFNYRYLIYVPEEILSPLELQIFDPECINEYDEGPRCPGCKDPCPSPTSPTEPDYRWDTTTHFILSASDNSDIANSTYTNDPSTNGLWVDFASLENPGYYVLNVFTTSGDEENGYNLQITNHNGVYIKPIGRNCINYTSAGIYPVAMHLISDSNPQFRISNYDTDVGACRLDIIQPNGTPDPHGGACCEAAPACGQPLPTPCSQLPCGGGDVWHHIDLDPINGTWLFKYTAGATDTSTWEFEDSEALTNWATATGIAITSQSVTDVASSVVVIEPPVLACPIEMGFDNFQNGFRPNGWTFTNCNSDNDTYTSSGDYGELTPSMRFNNSGDSITTNAFGGNDELTFWLKGIGFDQTCYLLIEEYFSSDWHQLYSLIIPSSGIAATTEGPYVLNPSASIIRFTYEKHGSGYLAFDDVKICAVPTTTPTPSSSPTIPPTPTATISPSPSCTPTASPSVTPSPITPTPSASPSPTASPSPSSTPTSTPTPYFSSVLDNASFETGDFPPWWRGEGETKISIVSTPEDPVQNGTYAAEFQDITVNYRDRGIASNFVTISNSNNYDLRGWFYVKSAAGNIDDVFLRLRLEWYDYEWNHLGTYPGTTGWHNQAFNQWEEKDYHMIQPPAGATYVQVWADFHEETGPGNQPDVYADNFYFDEVRTPTPTPLTPPPTLTPSSTPTVSPTPTPSCTPTQTPTVAPSSTPSPTETPTPPMSPTPSPMPTGTLAPTPCIVLSEGFNDFHLGTRPSGWTFANCNADSDAYTSAENSGTAIPSLKLDQTDDHILTWSFYQPGNLYFWVKGQGIDETSALLVEEYFNSCWYQVTNISGLPSSGSVLGPFALNIDAVQLQFTYTKSAGNLAFDDVMIICAVGQPTPTPAQITPTPTPASTMTPAPTEPPRGYYRQTNPVVLGHNLEPVSVLRQPLCIDSGDYNGDGTADIASFVPESGLWMIRGLTSLLFGGTSDRPVSADYDGDGLANIAVFRQDSGMWAVRGFTRLYFGSSQDIAIPGDYDGDGSSDFGIFRTIEGRWLIRDITNAYLGNEEDLPIPGDYNGDGTKDMSIFRARNGLWVLKGISWMYFGIEGDLPVPGNYKGDGRWIPAIYRPAEALWVIREFTHMYFGGIAAGACPVPSDYDGDGTDDAGLFFDKTDLWIVNDLTRVYYGTNRVLPATR